MMGYMSPPMADMEGLDKPGVVKDFLISMVPDRCGGEGEHHRRKRTSGGLLESTLEKLQVDPDQGLSFEQVFSRRQQYGPNELAEGGKSAAASRLAKIGLEEYADLIEQYLEQFQNPLILLLIGSAFISLLLGQYDNAISIGLAVLVVGTVGFVQEYRTEKSLEALNKLAPPKCRVLRAGQVQERLASDLVPGDVVELRLGDRIPADLLLLESVGLEIDESMMTGEHEPKGKTSILPGEWPLKETETAALHTAFMGTLVKSGRGKGIVTAIGPQTELGRLFRLVEQTEDKKSPLQVSLDGLGNQLTLYSAGVIALISLGGLLQGRPLMEIFTVAVSLAVAAIPEGLPVVATITLALGVLRLSKKNVIVKKLPAVEALGSVTVLCADKTGTLTTNVLSVQAVIPAESDELILVTPGMTYDKSIEEILQVSTVCNNASKHDGVWSGNAVDVALMNFAESLGFNNLPVVKRISEVPFSSDIKHMLVQCQTADGTEYFVKGAPEVVLSMIPNKTDQSMSDRLHNQGLRTLALARGSSLDSLRLVGMLGMMDPPRPGIERTLASLREAHIKIIMVTGDAKETAVTLANAIGFPHIPSSVVSGEELSNVLSGSDPTHLLSHVSIVYRAMPHHKLMLVQALQVHTKAVVAMTGDGVNDAPALKMADIGVAMGKSGTDVAREASKLILMDDRLDRLLDGVHEGKAIFANIRHFVRFQLATSLAALGLIALSIFVPSSSGAPPLNPMQILLINIIMDGPPAQSLGVEPIQPEILTRPPRPRDTAILSADLLTRTGLSALWVLLGCLLVFSWECRIAPGDSTRTFTAFVLFSLVNAYTCRSLDKSVFRLGVLGNPFLAGSILVALITLASILYAPFLAKVFQTSPLSAGELASLLGVSLSLLAFDELVKWTCARRSSTARSNGYIPLQS